MNYSKIREKKIPKYQFGSTLTVLDGTLEERMRKKLLRLQQLLALGIPSEDANLFSDLELSSMYMDQTRNAFGMGITDLVTVDINNPVSNYSEIGKFTPPAQVAEAKVVTNSTPLLNRAQQLVDLSSDSPNGPISMEEAMVQAQKEQQIATAKQQKALGIANQAFGTLGFNAVNTEQKYDEQGNKVGLSEGGQMALGIASQAISKTLNAVDEATMGDKNFSASSRAIDSAVHGVSGTLMKSGNPFAMAAGAALEGLNWITKAGGRTVQGYDVNINNSGYGTDMQHQESESGRIWDKWSGATARKLAKRNEKARMALSAAEISNDIAYEQEARANSVDNVLQANLIALAGGIDTSLLGS